MRISTPVVLLLLTPVLGQDAPVTFYNPPPNGIATTWPAQSKQQLRWETPHHHYRIGVEQDGVPSDEDRYGRTIFTSYRLDGSGNQTYDWYVDIPPEYLALSPGFHIEFFEIDTSARRLYTAAYFIVSEEEVTSSSSSSTDAASTTYTATSVTSLITFPYFTPESSNTWTRSDASTPEVTHSSTAKLQTTSLASTASSPEATSGSLTMDTTTSHHPPDVSSDPQQETDATSAMSGGDLAAATDHHDASVQSPRQNDRAIWMGISIGIGLPLIALAGAAVIWNSKQRRRRTIALNYQHCWSSVISFGLQRDALPGREWRCKERAKLSCHKNEDSNAKTTRLPLQSLPVPSLAANATTMISPYSGSIANMGTEAYHFLEFPSSTTLAFFRIQPELRNRTHESLLYNPTPNNCIAIIHDRERLFVPSVLGLLLNCTQIRDEAEGIFYGSTPSSSPLAIMWSLITPLDLNELYFFVSTVDLANF